jgi:hypothetical protein
VVPLILHHSVPFAELAAKTLNSTSNASVSAAYLPVAFHGGTAPYTGLNVRNNGFGDVAIELDTGLVRIFHERTGTDWWFPLGNGHYQATAYAFEGPCAQLVTWGGNIYTLEIDFKANERRYIRFICLDVSRPPDESSWILYYYLDD